MESRPGHLSLRVLKTVRPPATECDRLSAGGVIRSGRDFTSEHRKYFYHRNDYAMIATVRQKVAAIIHPQLFLLPFWPDKSSSNPVSGCLHSRPRFFSSYYSSFAVCTNGSLIDRFFISSPATRRRMALSEGRHESAKSGRHAEDQIRAVTGTVIRSRPEVLSHHVGDSRD